MRCITSNHLLFIVASLLLQVNAINHEKVVGKLMRCFCIVLMCDR